MKFCIEFDPNQPGQLPSVSGGRPDNSLPGSQPGAGQLPSHGGWDRPDNSLPGSQPGAGQLPSHGGWDRPDNSLPGVDKPVDPEYGVDPKPGAPDQGLPMPQPTKPFTDAEKREIMDIAKAKFINTELSPMRSIVQAARWVLVTRKQADRPSYGRPDNTLPSGPGGRPDQGLPKPPGRPDQGLPGSQPGPDNSLPGGPPARPDQGLPAGPDQSLPTPPTSPTTPDNSLPPTATPKSGTNY